MPLKKNKRKAIQTARKAEVVKQQTKRGNVGFIAHSSTGSLGMAALAIQTMKLCGDRLPDDDREAGDD